MSLLFFGCHAEFTRYDSGGNNRSKNLPKKTDPSYQRILESNRKVRNIASALELLGWDQSVMMPDAGAQSRGEVMGTLGLSAQAILKQPELAADIKKLKAKKLPPLQRRNLELFEREHRKANLIPESLLEKKSALEAKGYSCWTKAREKSDASAFLPVLKEIVELQRELIRVFRQDEKAPYDVLLNEYEEGNTTEKLQPVFDHLNEFLPPLIREIRRSKVRPKVNLSKRVFPLDAQKRLVRELAKDIGFQPDRGRIDDTVHPFCTGLHPTDVRFALRYDKKNPACGILSALHEAGHGIYEQNLPLKWSGQPVGATLGLGIHESQSRLWEQVVGSSKDFWRPRFQNLKRLFPKALSGAGFQDFLLSLNSVKPGFIRVDADEVTYNLHIAIRFQLEHEIFNESLPIEKIPARWNELYKHRLGITPKKDALGFLQDVHWAAGLFGYFPTYTQGNLASVQFFNAAMKEKNIRTAFQKGNTIPLLDWLKCHIYSSAASKTADALLQKTCGSPLTPDAYLDYLSEKYTEIYQLA